MNKICYLCGSEAKLTSEHVIPQCLGGVLSGNLYCTSCNSECGRDVDVELARQFGRYATLLQATRERGDNQPFTIVTEEDGLELRCDGKSLVRAQPIVRINGDESASINEVEVIARSESELQSIFGGIARKYNIDPTLCMFEQVENSPPVASYEFVLDNSIIRRAIAKIAYGLACVRLPEELVHSDKFTSIRDFILGRSDSALVSSNFVHGDFMVDNQRPLHKIHLCLNREERILVGYVALFGTFRYTVLLSEDIASDVEWAGIDYTYNPVTQRELEGNENFVAPPLSREDVLAPKHSRAQVLAALQRGQDVIVGHSLMLEGASVEEAPKDGA